MWRWRGFELFDWTRLGLEISEIASITRTHGAGIRREREREHVCVLVRAIWSQSTNSICATAHPWMKALSNHTDPPTHPDASLSDPKERGEELWGSGMGCSQQSIDLYLGISPGPIARGSQPVQGNCHCDGTVSSRGYTQVQITHIKAALAIVTLRIATA